MLGSTYSTTSGTRPLNSNFTVTVPAPKTNIEGQMFAQTQYRLKYNRVSESKCQILWFLIQHIFPTTFPEHCLSPLYKKAVTFGPTLNDQKKYQNAQWSPKPRKFCFCLTAAAPLVFLLWTTKIALVAQQVAQRRQSGGRTITMVAQGLPGWRTHGGRHSGWSMDVIRGTKEAQWWYKGGRSTAQIGTQCLQLCTF